MQNYLQNVMHPVKMSPQEMTRAAAATSKRPDLRPKTHVTTTHTTPSHIEPCLHLLEPLRRIFPCHLRTHACFGFSAWLACLTVGFMDSDRCFLTPSFSSSVLHLLCICFVARYGAGVGRVCISPGQRPASLTVKDWGCSE